MTEKNSFEKAAEKAKKTAGLNAATQHLVAKELKKRGIPVNTGNEK